MKRHLLNRVTSAPINHTYANFHYGLWALILLLPLISCELQNSSDSDHIDQNPNDLIDLTEASTRRENFRWTNAAGDDASWTTALNWSKNSLPSMQDEVTLSSSDGAANGPIVGSSDSQQHAWKIFMTPAQGQEISLLMQGGTLNVADDIWMIAGSAAGLATLRVSGGQLIVGDELRIGGDSSGRGRLLLTGGIVRAESIEVRALGFIDISDTALLILSGDKTHYIQDLMQEDLIGSLGRKEHILFAYDAKADHTVVQSLDSAEKRYFHWTNAAGQDASWTTALNWSYNSLPSLRDEVILSSSDNAAHGPIVKNSSSPQEAWKIFMKPSQDQELQLHVQGGALSVGDDVWLIAGSASGLATLKVSGGVLSIGDELRVGGASSGHGRVLLTGGVVDAQSVNVRTLGSIDISGTAILKISGDQTHYIQGLIQQRSIVSLGKTGRVLVAYFPRQDQTIIRAESIGAGQSISNPVVYRVSDSVVMKYLGKYYLLGTASDGRMLVSDNLINWGPRIQVFSMDNQWASGEAALDKEIHAPELIYYNGEHHLYWTLNRAELGVRHIGHARTALGPLGPYSEPVVDTWFADFIDPSVFRDDDGQFYLYTVQFGNGNNIHVQEMQDLNNLAGSDRKIMTALSGTWETDDGSRINEGPAVAKYRDHYYMFYADNTSIGCAQSSGPLAFTNEDKYSYPVVDKTVYQDFETSDFGQPTLVRGPNGFEWWLVYFAKYNHSRKYVSIDRVLFFDRKLYVDGPTSSIGQYSRHSFALPPGVPTVGDNFDISGQLQAHWEEISSVWSVEDGHAVQREDKSHQRLVVDSIPATHYLTEVGVKLNVGDSKRAGALAYYKGRDNWLAVGLDQERRSWFRTIERHGVASTEHFSLDAEFKFSAFHTIRVTKNSSRFSVSIDGIPAPGEADFSTPFSGPGLPGLYTDQAEALFDGFIFTVGWDETDDKITGWGNAPSGAQALGSWSVGERGLRATNLTGANTIYKGDAIPYYEFIAQITPSSASSNTPKAAGICPVYVDASNWLLAVIEGEHLKVYGVKDGRALEELVTSVDHAESYNLRAVKSADAVRVFVNGSLKLTVPAVWPISSVGLFADQQEVLFNGISLIRHGSQLGSLSVASEPMQDPFDDGLLDLNWKHIAIHRSKPDLHMHVSIPEINFSEWAGKLRVTGVVKGNDRTLWYGNGLMYDRGLPSSGVARYDFDTMQGYSHIDDQVIGSAVGLRLWKDRSNWFEVRQTAGDGDLVVEMMSMVNGIGSIQTKFSAAVDGSLEIRWDQNSKIITYFLNGYRIGDFVVQEAEFAEYRAMIAAYTINNTSRLNVNIDDFLVEAR